MPPLLKLQKIITGVEGLGTWQPTQRDEPPSNQGWSVQKWLLAVEGRRAWLHRSPPHGRMEKIKKTDEKMEIPPSSLRCSAAPSPSPSGLFGCHPHTVALGSVIFLDSPQCFWFFAAASAKRLVKHVHFPEQQLSLALMDLACLHPLAFLITLSRDLLSPTIKLMNLAI